MGTEEPADQAEPKRQESESTGQWPYPGHQATESLSQPFDLKHFTGEASGRADPVGTFNPAHPLHRLHTTSKNQ